MRKHQFFVCVMLLLLCCGQLVRGKPAPVPITGPATACIGDVQSYSVSPAVAGHLYYWSVTAGGNVVAGNPSNPTNIQWVAIGASTITVQEQDSMGNVINSGTYGVTVYPIPAPFITTDSRVACQTFDTSKGKNDGTSAGFIYIPPASDPTDYILDDDNGCPKVCEYSYVTYYAHSTTGGSSTWLWNVSGGTIVAGSPTSPNITVQWGAAGAGHITLTETNAGSCVGTASVCIDIINRPKANFCIQPNTVYVPTYAACVNATLVFNDLSVVGTGSAISYWHWDFGDGSVSALQNPTHAYTSPGVYTVTLVVTNACGCLDSVQCVIKVDALQGPDIQCPRVVCEKDTASYYTNAAGCSYYNWTVSGGTIISGMGSPNITVQWGPGDVSGYGYVSLDVGSCAGVCPGTTTIKIPIIQSHPAIIKHPDPLCTGKPYIFTGPLWPSTVYHWAVIGYPGIVISGQDNNESTIEFPSAGTYTVHFWYENSLTFCGGDIKFTVNVQDPPTLSGDLSVCADGSTVHTYTLGATGDWTLTGPGGYVLTASGVSSFNATFPAPGTYTLAVDGTTFCPPDPLIIHAVDVPAAPNTITGPAQVCLGSPYTYTAGAPVAGTILVWSVSPTSAATLSATSGTDVTVTWSAPGVISVHRESVIDPHCPGLPLSISVAPFPINPMVTGPNVVCANSTYAYTDNYFIADETTWSINSLGSGSVVSGELSPNMTTLWNNVTSVTVATVTATVKKCGISASASEVVTINPAPLVTISGVPAVAICNGTTVTLTATSGAATYTWDFGDGTSGTGNPVTHTYNASHTSTATLSFVVMVTVSGSVAACAPTGAATAMINVIPGPYASISTPDPTVWCSTVTPSVNFSSVVTNNIGMPSYQWYNGLSTLGTSTTQFTSSTGNYYLKITDASGCTYTSNVISVSSVSCYTVIGCTPPPVSMTATVGPCGAISAIFNAPGATSVSWYATPGYTSLTPGGGGGPSYTASVNYNSPGYYTVWATATFPGGCTNTAYYIATIPIIAHYYMTWDCSTSPYTLTLHDISDVLAGYGPVASSWVVSGTGGGTSVSPNPSFALAAGTHSISYTSSVTTPGSGSCTVTGTVNAPVVTSVSFTATTTNTCEGNHIDFPMTVTGGPLTDWTWNYDGSTNYNINPGSRNFTWTTSASHIYTVSLTGHNTIGCPVGYSLPITIWHNDFFGSSVVPPTYVACGGGVTLSFASSSVYPTSTWAWSNGPTTPMDPVTATGNYFVAVTNTHSCHYTTDPNHVALLNSTPPVIYGDASYCYGDAVKLGGYMGAGYTYQWYRNGLAVGGATSDNFVDPGLGVGTYNYQLQVVTPVFMGVSCTLMSAVYTVTMNALPAPPVISGPTVVSCPLYQLQLTASGAPGTFNWSTGTPGVGPTNIVDHGGAVRCWLTDVNGCVSHTDVWVPSSSESYKDWFPAGCYTFCKDMVSMGAIQVYGPPGTFNMWEWMMGYSPVLSGSNSTISPLTIGGPGNYELMLNNGLCPATFAEMEVSLVPCECQKIIRNVMIKCDPDPSHPHGYIVQVSLFNPYSYPLMVNLGMNIGPMVPFAISLPPSSVGTYTFNFTTLVIPPPTTATLWVLYDGPSGQCYDYWKVSKLPICSWTPEKPAVEQADGDQAATGMLVYPNPAGSIVNVNYIYGNDHTADRRIAIYDATGRKVAETQVYDSKGSTSLSLSNLAAGVYLVRMEENGRSIHVQQLSVTR